MAATATLGSTLATVLVIWIVAIASPGPDVAQIMRTTGTSLRRGVACALGICSGNLVWIGLSITGVAAVITASPHVFDTIRVIGASYLGYLAVTALIGAVKTFRSKDSSPSPELVAAAPGAAAVTETLSPAQEWWLGWRRGLLTNLANPKAILFFLSIFTTVMPHDQPVSHTVIVVTAMILVQIAWFVSVAFASRSIARFLGRHGYLIDGIAGVVFLMVAVAILAQVVLS